jgi:acyl-CoA hydrolase
MYQAEYKAKLTTPAEAVKLIPARGTLDGNGGQLDFVRGAQRSKDGKSILTAYSTASKGTISRIVAKVEGPATDPRADTQYVVTEYGIANLRGKSTAQRAEALIAIAHPNFWGELMRQAREMGYL